MAWRQGSRKRANDAASFDLRLRPQDRVGGPPKARGGGRRRTGTFRLFPKRKGRAGKGAGKGSGKGRSRVGRIIYWGAVLALWGVIAVVGAHRLDRHAFAADPVAGNSQAPALDPDRRRQRRALATRAAASGGAVMPLSELPTYVPKAFIAIEDRRFYRITASIRWASRAPPSPTSCIAASRKAARRITQQLAKNLFLTQERTVNRKLQEVLLALWLERKFSQGSRFSNSISTASISAPAPTASKRPRSAISANRRGN